MVDVVDSIVAELIVRDVDKYEAGFNRATAAHDKFLASTGKLQRQTFDLGAEGRKYKAGVDQMARAEEQGAERITRTRKKRAADSRATDEAEVASAKRSAKAKADAEISEAQRSARIRKAVETGVANSRTRQGTGANLGGTVPREGDGGRGFMGATSVAGGAAAATAQAGAEKEVNHLLADQAVLQSRLSGLKGKDLQYAKDQLAELRLIGQLQRAGIAEDEIALRLEQRRAAVEAQRGRSIRANLLADASKFSEGLGLRRTGGGTAAVAGIATVAAAGVGAAVIQSALDYGKALQNVSDQLGVTTDDLQAYQKLARDAGVSQEQLTSAFGQFANNLGRAKQGEQDQIKLFKALGVNINDFAKAGDALPTIIDRISQIKDPAQRAAVETRLFGESGRRLDALLSGGADRVTELSVALQKTGKALSQEEIRRLDETARKMADLKNELQVEFAEVVTSNADSIVRLANSLFTLTSSIVQFLAAKPETIPALIGAIAGAKVGGLPGAAVGAVVGYGTGNFAREAAQNPKSAGSNYNLRTGIVTEYDAQGKVKSRRPIPRQAPPSAGGLRVQIDDGNGNVRDAPRDAQGNLVLPGAAAPATNSRVKPGLPNLAALSRLGTPAGPRGPSAEQLAKQADQRQRRYEDELGRAQDDLLQAQRDLTASADRRYDIDVQSENTALARRKQEIQREANEKQIDASRVKELQAAEEAASGERLKVLALQNTVRIENDANAVRQQMLDANVEMLGLQEQLATTAAERRDLAKQRLAAERRAETNSLGAIFFSQDPNVSKADRQAALDRYQSQDARFRLRGEQEDRANEGPLASYRRRINRTPAETSEAVEGYVVNELDAVHDAITGAIQKAIGVKDPLLSGLLDLLIDQVVMKPLLAALDKAKGEGGGGLSGFIQSIASVVGGGKTAGARAGGGNVVGGNNYLVGEHGPEVVSFGASGRVFPNGALPSIGAGGGGTTIIAPQHYDLSGVVMTEDLVRGLREDNRRYANAVAAQAGRAAVAAGPGRMQKLSNLGS